jgi:hypothetical protein
MRAFFSLVYIFAVHDFAAGFCGQTTEPANSLRADPGKYIAGWRAEKPRGPLVGEIRVGGERRRTPHMPVRSFLLFLEVLGPAGHYCAG